MLYWGLVLWLTLIQTQNLLAKKDPTIITYTVGEIPEGNKNLVKNRLNIFVRLEGFPNGEIDPRASKL